MRQIWNQWNTYISLAPACSSFQQSSFAHGKWLTSIFTCICTKRHFLHMGPVKIGSSMSQSLARGPWKLLVLALEPGQEQKQNNSLSTLQPWASQEATGSRSSCAHAQRLAWVTWAGAGACHPSYLSVCFMSPRIIQHTLSTPHSLFILQHQILSVFFFSFCLSFLRTAWRVGHSTVTADAGGGVETCCWTNFPHSCSLWLSLPWPWRSVKQ